MALELAACYQEKGQPESARETLGQSFAQVKPGPLAQQVGTELATICLHLDRPEQALSVCAHLLEYVAAGPERDRLLQLQAKAYRRQQKYGRAVETVLEQQRTDAPPQPTTPAVTSGSSQ